MTQLTQADDAGNGGGPGGPAHRRAPWVLNWAGAAAAGAPACGGKGWNLGRLHRYGFPIPGGGVLVADAYSLFMQSLDQPAVLEQLASVAAGAAAGPRAEQALARLRASILAAELPLPVAESVALFLEQAGLAGRPVAVRSSVTAEDSAAASFAGIHRSFLNVSGTAQVLEAIRGCYASVWTPQALAYRRRLGVDDAAAACAVVICAMVGGPGASAGAAFTCDPRTGRRDRVAISAGPGEAVVGGSVNPEELAVDVADDRPPDPAAGALRVAARQAPPGQPDPVLSDARALELARLALRVQWALGDGQDPQDIEWVHDGQRFWLLQARPVTRLPRNTFPAVAHLPVIWSNANLKDAIAGVQSTLSWSIIQMTLRQILFAAQSAVGYPLLPGLEVTRRFAGRAYFDLTTLSWAFYDALGVLPAQLNRMLGGHQPEIPVPPGNPLRGTRGWARLLARLRLLRVVSRIGREFPRDIHRAHAAARVFNARDLARLDNAGLLGLMHQLYDRERQLGPRFQLANSSPAVWQDILESLLQRVAPDRVHTLAAGLMAGSGQVTSAEHGYRLYGLAEAARQDPAAAAYLAGQPLDPQGWRRLPAESPFRAAMEQFLAEFGHRAVYEAELANPRWSEDPAYLLEQVQAMLAAGPAQPALDAARAAARATRAAAEAGVARQARLLRPAIRWVAERVRQASALREAGKSALVVLAASLRRMVLEAGRRMASAGVLDHSADVFYLSWVDLESYLLGAWDGTGARALIADRRAQQQAWLALSPPDLFILDAGGGPAPAGALGHAALPGAAAPRAAVSGPAAGVLTGVGVAAGRARGPARVIRHPAEGQRLQPGDVLVAPSTDPGWTPLFLRASAVVMEAGGYLSHGAIVAREYGLPAVVNIPGLLEHVRDGQQVTVDGDSGRVELQD